MCGRFVSASELEEIAAYFDAEPAGFDLARSYNVAPTADIAAVVEVAGENAGRRVEAFRWGLVPPWSADPRQGSGKGPPLFNARSETAATKNSFRGPFKRRRCIVPADGFYEWPKAPRATPRDQRPLPHFITRTDGEMLAMAGLWERWTPHDSKSASAPDPAVAPPEQALYSATVLTTEANEFLAPIHNRMPVLLARSDWDAWLDPANEDVEALASLMVPAPEGLLRSHEVSRAVGNVRNRSPGLIEPAAQSRPPLL